MFGEGKLRGGQTFGGGKLRGKSVESKVKSYL